MYKTSNSKQKKGTAMIMSGIVGVFINDHFKQSIIGTSAVPLEYVLRFHHGVPNGFPPGVTYPAEVTPPDAKSTVVPEASMSSTFFVDPAGFL